MNTIYNSSGHTLLIPDVSRGDGIYLYDGTGKRWMDLESGIWCTSLGHNHPRIRDLLKAQADKLMHAGFCYSSRVVDEAAGEVLAITGFTGGRCVFLCSGSEAIELARQIARRVTSRTVSMTLHDSYLGSYSSVTDRSSDWFIFDWTRCADCADQECCRRDCEMLQEIPDTISEFIFEPGSSSGFVRFPPASLIGNLVAIVRRQGGKIVINEVTTGMGRTGTWFGYDHYPVDPDMVAIGKGVGNGYPVSVTAINDETVRELEGSSFKYLQSHQNDPLGAAIAGEVIRTMRDEDLVSRARENGAIFLAQLQELEDGSRITGVRGRGLMFGIDLRDERLADSIYHALIGKGFIVCKRQSLFRIDPPLTTKPAEFELFIQAFREVLRTCSD